tara:strand:- start:8733 stop:10823 length:2091 start_codon:yes stop_codon:yes gene_type:complete
MQKLQLFIGTDRVELFKDETVSLTQTIQNVRDIKKIFTEFTKTFSVPASKKNNIIFEHYYNFHIENGYDARIKKEASIELNSLPFKIGKIKLDGVDLKNNIAHTYRITFFGNTVDLKDILGDNNLSSLSSLSQYNLDYNNASVRDKLRFNTGAAIIAPLITHTDQLNYNSSAGAGAAGNLYYGTSSDYQNNGVEWNQLKYAIKINAVIQAIQDNYDITFSTDFFNNIAIDKFNELFLWLHRKKGNVTPTEEVPIVWTTVNSFSNITSSGSGIPEFITQNNGIVSVNQVGVEPVSNTLTITPTTSAVYTVRLMSNNNGEVNRLTDVTGPQDLIPADLILVVDTYWVQVYSLAGISFAIDNMVWRFDAIWRPAGSPINIFRELKNNNSFTSTTDIEFNIVEQIPQIKIIDFLTGIFQMFNLTAYVENGIIVVKTLDSYYASSSSVINIDRYLDTKKSTVNLALPFKSVSFGYKGINTLLAKKFNQLFNKNWGSEHYSLDDEIFDTPSESYKIEVPFEHMQFERLFDQNSVGTPTSTTAQYGWFVDDNRESYYGLPLLFYPVFFGVGDATPIALRNITTKFRVASYFIPSNSLSITELGSKENINFGNYLNEFLANEQGEAASTFTDTLFETEYKTYIQDVFNIRRRLTIVTAYLPMKIFLNLKLNDLIQLGQNNYKINSLTTDLTTGKTKFELLNTVI